MKLFYGLADYALLFLCLFVGLITYKLYPPKDTADVPDYIKVQMAQKQKAAPKPVTVVNVIYMEKFGNNEFQDEGFERKSKTLKWYKKFKKAGASELDKAAKALKSVKTDPVNEPQES